MLTGRQFTLRGCTFSWHNFIIFANQIFHKRSIYMKIVFMGTPDFAVPSLKILLENGYEIVGVITSTDKMGGRGGKKLIESAVKRYAMEQGLNLSLIHI